MWLSCGEVRYRGFSSRGGRGLSQYGIVDKFALLCLISFTNSVLNTGGVTFGCGSFKIVLTELCCLELQYKK